MLLRTLAVRRPGLLLQPRPERCGQGDYYEEAVVAVLGAFQVGICFPSIWGRGLCLGTKSMLYPPLPSPPCVQEQEASNHGAMWEMVLTFVKVWSGMHGCV